MSAYSPLSQNNPRVSLHQNVSWFPHSTDGTAPPGAAPRASGGLKWATGTQRVTPFRPAQRGTEFHNSGTVAPQHPPFEVVQVLTVWLLVAVIVGVVLAPIVVIEAQVSVIRFISSATFRSSNEFPPAPPQAATLANASHPDLPQVSFLRYPSAPHNTKSSTQLSPAKGDFLKHLTPLKQLQQKCHKSIILANRIPESLPVQRVPRVSHIPWIPHISCTSHIPRIPVSIIQWLPWVTKISNITWVPQVPWISDVPWVSQVPWVPVVSGITHVSASNVSSVSSISPIPAIPAISGVSPRAPPKRGAVTPGISAIPVGILLSEENTREIPLAC